MASGYLLDTNHIHAVISRMPQVIKKIELLPKESQIRTCVINLGEFEAGHSMTKTTDQRRRDAATFLVNEKFLPSAMSVTTTTRTYYAKIMGRLWDLYPPKHGDDTEKYLVTKHDVQINDVWAVAVAYEHNFTFVTSDEMQCIRAAVPNLKFECWK